MYTAGNILYFTPFYFKNGNPAKPKYFIVLKNIGDTAVIASLPTRIDHIPRKMESLTGCVEDESIGFNCFVFAPEQNVTLCDKCFEFKTFIYGHQLDDYSISELNEIYPKKEIDYKLFGEMKPVIFEKLIDCLKNSKIVKRKYIKMLKQ